MADNIMRRGDLKAHCLMMSSCSECLYHRIADCDQWVGEGLHRHLLLPEDYPLCVLDEPVCLKLNSEKVMTRRDLKAHCAQTDCDECYYWGKAQCMVEEQQPGICTYGVMPIGYEGDLLDEPVYMLRGGT